MKNLAVHTHTNRILNDEHHSDLRELLSSDVLCCTNPNNDDLYVLKGVTLYEISSVDNFRVSHIDLEDVEEPRIPVGLEYSIDLGQVWCAYASGLIVAVNTQGELRFENSCHVGEGLQCLQLDPNQEILILITANDTVITTIPDFPIHILAPQVHLHAADYGKNQFITVGWGKKETQFHGTEGKAAAKAQAVDAKKTENDDGQPRITWKSDGSMFAVSFLHKESQARLFKVFNRDGVLLCTSHMTDGLEPQVAWKPSSNLIATSQLHPSKHVVAFFEKNGLKHREMSLPFKPKEIAIINMQWTFDSEVLSIWLKDVKTGNTCLQLWTQKNYHWYLKQTIKFTTENPLVYFTWSAAPRAGKRLILLTREKLITYSFHWRVDRSRGTNLTDKAVVGVIDGSRALLTGFRMAVVPPPMAHQSVEMDEAINSIIFAPSVSEEESVSFDSNFFMCLLGSNRLGLCAHSKDAPLLEYELLRTHEIEWKVPSVIGDNDIYPLHHFLWLKKNVMLCSATSSTHSYLCVLNLEGEDFIKEGRVVVSETCAVDGHIEHIVPSPDPNIAYVISDKSIFKYVVDSGLVPAKQYIPESCFHVEVVEVSGRHVFVSQTTRSSFFVNHIQTASNITSFTVHPEFLLLTTHMDTLISIKLSGDSFGRMIQDLSIVPWEDCTEISSFNLEIRRVERGSRLIISVPQDARTILQMPRGNLECIQPRVLSLHIIATHLENLNYTLAFDMIRKQRINLNVIYDVNPGLFLTNMNKFVSDVNNPSWLSLFLSELQEENVMETMYKSNMLSSLPHEEFCSRGKVDLVCERMRAIMEENDVANRYIQPILTSLVKNQQIPGLEAALRKVKEVREQEKDENSVAEKSRKISSEEAIRYLVYLVDVDVLLDIAMGMHDLELALFVASKSRKDPKEYIPLLEDLKKKEVNYMKFLIDKNLKRYETALNHIAKAPDKFDECLEFICAHQLYAKGLKLYSRQSEEYKLIAGKYASFLMTNGKYYEAGIMFTRNGDLKNAVGAFKMAGSWQDAIALGMQMDLSPRDMQEFFQDLVWHLSGEKMYRQAAQILVTHLQQHEEAVWELCKAREWREAMHVAHSVKRLDLIETHVKPGVQQHAAVLLREFEDTREEFDERRSRLKIVRQENAKRMQEALENGYEFSTGRENSDLISETGSIAGSHTTQSSQVSRSSKSSTKSYRSGKSQRKMLRKALSIKEGSPFEELAIIRDLHIKMEHTYKEKEPVKLVTELLLNFDQDDVAEKLQNTFGELVNYFERNKHEIWPKLNEPLEARGNIPKCLLEPQFKYPPPPNL